jgi:hypothetical protein
MDVLIGIVLVLLATKLIIELGSIFVTYRGLKSIFGSDKEDK